MTKEPKILDISEGGQVRITYSALFFILAGVMGFGTWMTTMQINVNANAAGIDDMRIEKEETRKIIIRIDKSVTSIKTYLKLRNGDDNE